MAYSPLWEPLADSLSRVMLTGISELEAKLQIAAAIGDRQVPIRLTVDRSDRDIGGSVIERGNINPPVHLGASDFDWPASRPLKPWATGPDFGEHYNATYKWRERRIALVELSTSEVTRIWCSEGERLGRRAAIDDRPAPELPVWFTPMEAVAWIVARDERIVGYASLDRNALRTYFIEHVLPNGKRVCAETEAPPGMTLLWLDAFAAYDPEAIAPTDQALAELLTALRQGRLTARGQWAATGDRRDMPADEWASLKFGTPPRQASELQPFRIAEHCPEKRWRDIRFPQKSILALWPRDRTGSKTIMTAAKERRLEAWLTAWVREHYSSPVSKAETKKAADGAGLMFSVRGFERAWDVAIHANKAAHWKKGGRKSKRRIDTPT